MSAKDVKIERQNRDALSDMPLVEALRNYEESAFMTLVDQYQVTMVRIAQRYVDDVETAKEVVQETWLAVLRGVHEFAGRASFKTWLFTILVNRARTRGKQAKHFVPFGEWAWEQWTVDETHSGLEPQSPSQAGRTIDIRQAATVVSTPEEQMLQQEMQAQIEEAILALPPAQREVMILRDIEGWPAAEICLVLDLSEVNQRVLLHRARSKVRLALEPYFRD
jgi:RNA polymerase sigma-70 factor, ECF subfamily